MIDRHVFVNYRCDHHSKVVDKLVAELKGNYRVLRDKANIRGGQDWREKEAQAIASSFALVLLVSPETEPSKDV